MGIEVIDFTELQKRGIVKASIKNAQPEILDMTNPGANSSETGTASAFDFLDSLSHVGSNNANPTITGSSNLDVKLDAIANKLEDAMYKLETLISRISQLEARLDLRS